MSLPNLDTYSLVKVKKNLKKTKKILFWENTVLYEKKILLNICTAFWKDHIVQNSFLNFFNFNSGLKGLLNWIFDNKYLNLTQFVVLY